MGSDEVTTNYSEGAGCVMCYVKHLSKASIEFTEFLEDNSRYEEFSRFIGDLACAEDHAAALGKDAEKEAIRDIRNRAWDMDPALAKELQAIVNKATRNAVISRMKENMNRSKPRSTVQKKVKPVLSFPPRALIDRETVGLNIPDDVVSLLMEKREKELAEKEAGPPEFAPPREEMPSLS